MIAFYKILERRFINWDRASAERADLQRSPKALKFIMNSPQILVLSGNNNHETYQFIYG